MTKVRSAAVRAAMFALTGAMLTATALPAQERSQALSASAATAAAKPAGPQTKYCVVTDLTGSRLERRTCKTEQEWRERGIDIHKELRAAERSRGRQ